METKKQEKESKEAEKQPEVKEGKAYGDPIVMVDFKKRR